MDENPQQPKSLLPYDEWTEEALRHVVMRALDHVAANGLPGGHHFYISFRTDLPGVELPARLRAQYPREMTIVLQHQFWDLKSDAAAGAFSVGLSFGGIPTMLHVPFAAVTAFVDPEIRYGLQFRTAVAEAPASTALIAQPQQAAEPEEPAPAAETPQVVSLDAFRRKPKDS